MSKTPPPAETPAKASRALSHLLDELFKIPGTKFRFGLDPLLSIIPFAGAGAGALFGSVIMVDAIRLKAPVSVILRMLANHVINWLLGMIPAIGPFFDAWFKSNSRNLKLLDRTIADRDLVRRRTLMYWAVAGFVVVVLVALVVAAPFALLLALDAYVTSM